MKKALVYASVASMIQQFNMNNIKLLQELGYKVDVACNMENGSSISDSKISELEKELKEMDVTVYHIAIPRSIFKISDILFSLEKTKQLIADNQYMLIHCHSPIGGMICRLANRFSGRYQKSKMIYTAHGFHFYKGAPIINWLIYFPIEMVLSKWTDTLITINNEDYKCAKKWMYMKNLAIIPGVGVDIEKFNTCSGSRDNVRESLGICKDDFVVISVGEVNKNKNHQVIIRALERLNDKKIHYIIVGKGNMKQNLIDLAERLGISEQIHFLGYRSDVNMLYEASDVFCFPSIREGLGLAAIEAMASGLPIITSNIHGINDYSVDGITGYKNNPMDVNGFAKSIEIIKKDADFRNILNIKNRVVANNYSIKNAMEKTKNIYELM